MQVCLFVFVACTVHIMNYGHCYMDGVTLVAQLSITIFMLVKDNDCKMQMIMTKTAVALSKLFDLCVCRQSVELKIVANNVCRGTRTHKQRERERAKKTTDIYSAGNSHQLFSSPIFSAICVFGKFPSPTKYAIEECFWPAFFVCVEKLSNIFQHQFIT